MDIIGQIVFRVEHAKFENCNGPDGFNMCYVDIALDSDRYKENIIGKLKNHDDEWNEIPGKPTDVIYEYDEFKYTKTKNSDFTKNPDGYYLYFRPDMSREEFKLKIDAA